MARRKKKIKPGLLIDSYEQLELMDKSMEHQVIEEGEVECLGMKFPNDEERRKYFLEILREKLKDPEFRKIEGFPIGEDEDILALSDPPYYTACPNPFLEKFIKYHSSDMKSDNNYIRKPYLGSLSATSRHPVYNFHPYSTKVPPDIIRSLIENFTDPGDFVFDGFCGTGMTGVAAREVGRYAVVGDLCPAATFISGVSTTAHNWKEAITTFKDILRESQNKWGYLYETVHNSSKLPVNYYVLSDVFTCPECVQEFTFFPHGVIHHGNKVETKKSFPCPYCDAELNVRRVNRVMGYEGKKYKLVWVNAGKGKNRVNREPNSFDIDLLKEIDGIAISDWFPTDKINVEGYTAKLAQLGDKGITDVSRFLSKRNLIIFSDLWNRARNISDASIRRLSLATLSSIFTVISERQGYFGGGGGMSGNLYMPIVRMEKNVYDVFDRKLEKLVQAEQKKEGLSTNAAVTTQSATDLQSIPSNSMDYIYTDPPFGANIIYSEMNLVIESWLRIKTNKNNEAVIDETRGRHFEEYAKLMRQSFSEYYRILKPGCWMNVEFHNTKASVWNLIQNTIGESGFIIAQVDILDKGSTTILADIRPGAAKQDLIITAYKPNDGLEARFKISAGTEGGAWDFIRTHLKQLPIFVSKDGELEVIAERQNFLLFDRMVAFHVQRGVSVPISAGDFYKGLAQRFPERDGMYFLPEQVAEYDKKRMSVNKVLQLQLFVNDEASAIQWLKQQLTAKPQTFQDIHPVFMRELGGWQKHEKPLELSDLLAENFLRYDGQGEVPSQIHSYLSSNFKELRNLQKDDPKLKAKARDRWYVPDPNKAGDLEKIRERSLLKEFEEYKESTQRKLKVFRLEAIRAGFKKAWQEKDYKTIIDIAKKIPDNVLQEDSKLLMWYDQALTRRGEE